MTAPIILDYMSSVVNVAVLDKPYAVSTLWTAFKSIHTKFERFGNFDRRNSNCHSSAKNPLWSLETKNSTLCNELEEI